MKLVKKWIGKSLLSWFIMFGTHHMGYDSQISSAIYPYRTPILQNQSGELESERNREGPPPAELPDGLEDMSLHNLMTYKSHQESLDGWALDELLGHFVNYRKSVGSRTEGLPPIEDFRLYAVTARYPAKLAEAVELERQTNGVYDVRWGIRNIRIIVLSRISPERKNAIWQLFSAVPEKIAEGMAQYHWRGAPSIAINQLFKAYKLEGVIAMSYTMEDFRRDVFRENLQEILEIIPVEELLNRLSDEEIVEVIKKRLSKSDQKKIQEFLREKTEEE